MKTMIKGPADNVLKRPTTKKAGSAGRPGMGSGKPGLVKGPSGSDMTEKKGF